MCGIAGIWNVRCERPQEALAAMLDSMRHRGPDGRGTLHFEGGAAGMVRLALVDLSDRGQQPLWSIDRRVAILFNGEMYNFREERERLAQSGYSFKTTTDTEVILALYLERGLDFVERIRGMYALAIHDWRQASEGGLPVLLLVRGPLGIKHLYAAHPQGRPDEVIFASEIRSLLASGLVVPNISREALAGYLAHGFVLQPETILSNVRMLEPGTIERYAPGQPMSRIQYWQVPPYEPRQESLDESAARLRQTFEESVRLHALADAPIGAFLSGGVDSTAIVGLMRKHVSDLRTYTLEFPDIGGNDEVAEAASAARRFDCQHTLVSITSRDVAEALPRFAGELDQPSTDGLNTWLISRAAAKDVKGVLSGLGGDEWFAGYPVARRMSRYDQTLLGRMHTFAGKLAHALADAVPRGKVRDRIHNLSTRRSALATWLHAHTVFRHELARRMVGLGASQGVEIESLKHVLTKDVADWRRETMVGLACLLDSRVYMISQLLRDSDATSMAHSLELRVPFVDLHLVGFSRSCADEYKLRPDGGDADHYTSSGSKRVLIRALQDVLPPDLAGRRKKGFSLPYENWMQSDLAPLVAETTSREALLRRGWIDPDWAYPRRGPGTLSAFPRRWSLMIFELWCRAVLDTDRRKLPITATAGV